jgi:diguanylate cyclase (GGDEF)-like protein
MYEIAHTLGTSLSLEDTMALIESKLSRLIPFSACALFLYDEQDQMLRCRVARGVDSELVTRFAMRAGHGVNGWAAQNRRPVVNGHARRDAYAASVNGAQLDLRSALAWPLVLKNRLIGTLALYHVKSDFYTDRHCLPLDRICEQVSAVVHNALRFEQAQTDSLTDPLTGLANGRQLRAHVTNELARSDRQDKPMALFVVDVNELEALNERFGRETGDRALTAVGRALESVVRPYDLCARYTGDSFVVVLSDCDRDAALNRSLEFKRAVESVVFEGRPGSTARLSISCGSAVYPIDAASQEDLLAAADRRMCRDKAARQSAFSAA